ncbi:MAG: tRNA epoxyqueuosine(34) reductase QueG [Chloroflexi bacterium]|nr:tRNA epoxyqueuosine(34) reductase QueG [Chloroflexota bacterium]
MSIELTQQIKEHAISLGFDLVGVTTPDSPPHLDAYVDWLDAGYHGDMGFLATERAQQRRADPRSILPECESILVLGIPYDKPASPPSDELHPSQGQIAAYAWGADYHETLKSRLKQIIAFIEEQVGAVVPNRYYTDTGPILERELAQRAGLGWIGKNSMLINPQRGSYYLLAEILLGLPLVPDAPISTDHCGTCTLCIEACPTDCILDDRTLNASRCISYLSIELKDAIPLDLRPKMGQWVFGCDICQQVCPWNIRFASERGDPEFAPRTEVPIVDLPKELSLSTQEFNRKFKGSPVKRAKRRGYLRNVAVALGNAAQSSNIPALSRALEREPEPLVRAHVAWSLGRSGAEAKPALERALQTEEDQEVRKEIERALAHLI